MPLKYFAQAGVQGIPIILVAFGAATLAILPFCVRERAHLWKHWRNVALMIAAGGFANFAFTLAIVEGDVIRVVMLFFLAPVWGVIGGRVFLKEKVSRQRALAVVMALLGAFWVLGGTAMFKSPPSWIDLLALAAGFAFAMNNVACRYAQTLSGTGKTASVFVGCTLLAALYLAFTGETLPSPAVEIWLWVILYGVVGMMVLTYLAQWAVTKVEAGRAHVIMIMELLVAVASASFIGGEDMSSLEIIGGLLILCATFVEAWRPALKNAG